jgi:acetylornithine deacetylase/succinyl-diaminopimelate desuccinylase-like protein
VKENQEVSEIWKYIDDHFEQHLEKGRDYLRIPSVSLTDTEEGRTQMMRGAEFVLKLYEEIGADGEIVPTTGFPIVYGKLLSKNPQAKTVLIYLQYDVQPADEKEWKFPPFEARIVNAEEIDAPAKLGKVICARGAMDQKLPGLAILNAAKSMLAVTGDVPVNFLFMAEGEEEITSPSILEFIEKYKHELGKASAELAGGRMQDINGIARIDLGWRGLVAGELHCEGGEWGGPAQRVLFSTDDAWVDAPIWRLTWALNSIKDTSGKVLIDGFYDNIVPPTPQEKGWIEKIEESWDEEESSFPAGKKVLGIKKYRRGLSGRDLLYDYFFTPVFNIDGIEGGYTGPKVKTNLPHRAYAKFDIRLVPNQDPDDIILKLRKHLYTHGFPEVEVHITQGIYPPAVRVPFESDIIQAAVRTFEKMGVKYVVNPQYWAAGPHEKIRRPLGLSGRGLHFGVCHGDRYHSANEYLTVKGLKDSEKSWVTYLYEYSKL